MASRTVALSNRVFSWISDWPVWWSELSFLRKWSPITFIAIYLSALSLLHGLREDHINTCIALLILCYGGRPLESLLRFFLPLLLTGIIYDSQRFYSDYIRGPIHVSQPYEFDKRFFGIHTAHGVLTPNEWWQLHTYPVLDVITGFMYLFFIAIYVAFAAYFFFYLAKKGTAKLSALQIRARALSLMWGFLWLNLLGYSTYYWYAAAPPWYVAAHGLGPADLSTRANPAGCVRFDHVLGTHFFSGMYGRAADVFGAIPSLHVAYPLMAVFFAFRFGSGRIFAICFYFLMCFSAIYLNHHYVLDILWGSAYAILISILIDRYYLGVAHRTAQESEPPLSSPETSVPSGVI